MVLFDKTLRTHTTEWLNLKQRILQMPAPECPSILQMATKRYTGYKQTLFGFINLAIKLSDWSASYEILTSHLVHTGVTTIISTCP